MAFNKTGAPEKQKVVMSEEEVEREKYDDGEVIYERELDTEQLPEDDEDEQERE